MMKLSDFQFEVLGWVMDDYESLDTITEDIRREFGSSVEETEILEALISLVKKCFVQPYIFDQENSRYRKIEPIQLKEHTGLWFCATQSGRDFYVNNS
jgi:hypothetical protein